MAIEKRIIKSLINHSNIWCYVFGQFWTTTQESIYSKHLYVSANILTMLWHQISPCVFLTPTNLTMECICAQQYTCDSIYPNMWHKYTFQTWFQNTAYMPSCCTVSLIMAFVSWGSGVPVPPNLKTRTPHPSPIDIPNNLTRPSFMFINKNIYEIYMSFQLCLGYRYKWYFTRARQLWF